MSGFRQAWLALGGVWVAAIIYLSLVPHPPQPISFEYSDKLEHMLAYGLLMLWFCQIFSRPAHRILMAILLILLGIGMEYVQGMIGYRYFEFADMLSNSAGVLLGWALASTALGKIGIKLETILFK